MLSNRIEIRARPLRRPGSRAGNILWAFVTPCARPVTFNERAPHAPAYLRFVAATVSPAEPPTENQKRERKYAGMNRIASRIAIALLICAASAAGASAKVKGHLITFGQDFTVGGTTVKAGTYNVSFDDQKNELIVSDKKTKEVVAKADAGTQARKSDVNKLEVQLAGDGTQALVGIAFPGEKQLVTVSGAAAQQKQSGEN
jgi:hypothetical protein